jgi:hypothetical protein
MPVSFPEERTRVVLYLPNNNKAENRAVAKTIRYIQGLRKVKLGQGKVVGFTQSRFPQPFMGWWYSKNKKRFVPDKLDIIILDHELDVNNPKLATDIEKLKNKVAQFYREKGSPQEEIWIVAHPVWRYA